MTVRCVQCGQENNPQYRFCGMCGAPLGLPPAAVREEVGRERVRVPVSGPSFLGLGDERSRDLDYLLEDDPPRGHGRLYFALLLLALSGALLAWHWQRDGYPWTGYIQRPVVNSRPPVNSAAGPDPAAAAVPVEPTANPAPPETKTATEEAPQSAAAEPPADTPSAAAKPPDRASPGQAQTQTQTNDGADSGETPAKAPAAASQTAEPPTSEPAGQDARAVTATPVPPVARPKPSPVTPSATFEDRLVADGERYLYGRGVPEDCERAQRNLQIAARQSNAKAQTLLGAMYATGHCVGRDLPSAYRWFAKALHGDPSNSRVQRDLEVLWKQMTPEERQLAMKNQ